MDERLCTFFHIHMLVEVKVSTLFSAFRLCGEQIKTRQAWEILHSLDKNVFQHPRYVSRESEEQARLAKIAHLAAEGGTYLRRLKHLLRANLWFGMVILKVARHQFIQLLRGMLLPLIENLTELGCKLIQASTNGNNFFDENSYFR